MVSGNTIDFLSELTGLVPFEYQVKKKAEKEFAKLKGLLECRDSFALAELKS